MESELLVHSEDFPCGYVPLRSLSQSSHLLLCREDTSGRLVVVKPRPLKMKERFTREVKALAALGNCKLAPRLYFAFTGKENHYLGLEHRLGKTLLHLREGLSTQEVKSLGEALKKTLKSLHSDYQYSHGDISPANILAHEGNTKGEWKISLLDWEFSNPLDAVALAQYDSFHGTPGFTSTRTAVSLIEKDRESMKAVLDFFGYTEISTRTPLGFREALDKGLQKWLRRK